MGIVIGSSVTVAAAIAASIAVYKKLKRKGVFVKPEIILPSEGYKGREDEEEE